MVGRAYQPPLIQRAWRRPSTLHTSGHEATALEKKDIRIAKGDYNREIKRRNQTRAELIRMTEQAQIKQLSRENRTRDRTPDLNSERTHADEATTSASLWQALTQILKL
ncbi:hypothetical protein [Candidatus Bathycorpusculum sp.]|uniref:hypothetical protein n=1 Tax=Candidatus Bathycorpusculum sp. TaxID=2994959 RepID=UPI00281B0C5A|nr:hypothetical protein [Candidatus Termitimicrobium sp.]MCL2686430.1 hypothetical protein [Candidatus Termitimicrobium sp.]